MTRSLAAEQSRNQAKRCGHLLWTRICAVCAQQFTQRRAGRPRLSCSPACSAERTARLRKVADQREPCQACGRRHALEPCGDGYRFCSRTDMHFRPAEQLALGKDVR